MRKRGFLQIVFVVGALAVASACGSDDSEPQVSSPVVTVTSPSSAPGVTTPNEPGVSVPQAKEPTSAVPPKEQPQTGSGTVIIRTHSLQGIAIPYVPVNLRLYQGCDPNSGDFPEGLPEAQRWDDTTDANGQAVFAVPVGCYRFGMNAPAGTNPVPEGLHTIFVKTDGETVYGSLRFQDPAPSPLCASQTIVHDLDVAPYLKTATPTVTDCDGFWAFIAWADSPGDNARIVHRDYGTPWTTYVLFPHDVCRAEAQADGIPANLEKYFQVC